MNLKMLSLITLQERLSPGVRCLVKNFRMANITPWLVTSDAYQRALSAAFNSNILLANSLHEIIHFDGKTEEELLSQMKSHVKTVKDLIQGKKPLTG